MHTYRILRGIPRELGQSKTMGIQIDVACRNALRNDDPADKMPCMYNKTGKKMECISSI